jgi:PAS domain S-box-containing protein
LGLAFLALIGYAYVAKDFQGGMASFTKMAIHTSAAFVFLSVGMLFSKPDKGIMRIYTNDGIAGITTRKLLPVIIFIPLIVGRLRLIGQDAGYYDTEFGVALFSFITIFILVVVVFGISGNLLSTDKKRKEAEGLLKEYKHFFNNSNDLACIANMEGHFEIINPQFKKVLGYSEKELLEKQFIEFIHPDDIAATLQEYEKQQSDSKVVINFVNRYRKKDGNYLWFDWNSTPDPVTGKIYAIARDITERKKAEQELEIITEKLKDAQALAKVGNWNINLANNVSTWSDETYKILGLSLETTTPSLDTYLSCIHPNDLGFVKEKVNEVFATLKGNTFNYRIKRKDGTIIHAVSQSSVDFDKNNSPTHLFGIIQDITEIKNAEEKLIEINKELESFSYSVSHDLRAPLRAINGYAQILNEDYGKKLDTEGIRILETIKHNAIKMGTLIDDLLAFSRLGRKEIQKTEVDMNKLTESVINEMNKSMMHKTEINIAKLHKVKADYSLLHQVMFNLVSNAVKYSSKGENPVVKISSKEKNGEIVFSVADNGVGFDMQYADKLFGVFQRLHSHEEFEGTGVGLAIVQRIITKHGGKVWAEGIVNKGAVFNFSLTKN